MPTLILDMPCGVAGDMLLAALLACGGDRERLERDLLALGCGPIRIAATPVMAGPLSALRVEVDAEQEARWIQAPAIAGIRPVQPPETHAHRPYATIRDLLAAAPLPERVRTRAQRAFRLLAEAEGAVHGVPADTVEFHEVGSLDAIADVVGCCLLLEQLGIDRVLAGPIAPGRGTVRCAHGLMPVPVPAVAEMLKATGAPVRLHAGDTGELTTPTGCALVCALTDAFLGDGAPLLGTITASGSGAGHKTIPGLVNAVRALIIEERPRGDADNRAVELCANLDDMTGEDLALAVHGLLTAGALDAWTTPTTMKKGRPGQILHALCRPDDETRLSDLMLTTTSTIGVRSQTWARRILPRRTTTIDLDGQSIRLKIVTLPDGSERAKPEADDVAAAAAALGRTVAAVRADLARCALP
jgi:uncharacterized protein (TIGR00299 family) protein